MTVLEVIQKSTDFLARKGIDSPRLQVELLLGSVLGVARLKLYLDFERKLSEPELDQMRSYVKRRSNREPLQHIVGSTSFCGTEISVNRDVLVPRPETELLAEKAWKYLLDLTKRGPATPRVLDFGTGSGCLAIVIAQRVPSAAMTALDISAAALVVAKQNAARHGVSDRIRFYEGRGLASLPLEERGFDLIVANPPYIPSAEIHQLDPEVRDYDPRLALDGGVDGLENLQDLAASGLSCLSKNGHLMCEFGDGQDARLRVIFESFGWIVDEIEPDLTGRPRILVAHSKES